MACILVVEDDDFVRFTLRKLLERAGYQVVEATNGDEAIDFFRDSKPDLVITDIVMPKKGGCELIPELRQENPAQKIIAISGGGRTGNMDYLELAKEKGADDVLSKPFVAQELLATVASLLREVA